MVGSSLDWKNNPHPLTDEQKVSAVCAKISCLIFSRAICAQRTVFCLLAAHNPGISHCPLSNKNLKFLKTSFSCSAVVDITLYLLRSYPADLVYSMVHDMLFRSKKDELYF